jgi:hypothetical protein
MNDNIFCPTTAAARGRALLEEQGIELPYMTCDSTIAARRGIIRLLKLAKALKLTQEQALEYGFMTPSNRGIVQRALIQAWNKSGKKKASK